MTGKNVTPLVLQHALKGIADHDNIARRSTLGHWQSDVIAGFAPGTAAGYFIRRHIMMPLAHTMNPTESTSRSARGSNRLFSLWRTHAP